MKLIIPGRLPGLNEIIRAAKMGKGRYQPYSEMKHEYGDAITLLAQRLPKCGTVKLLIKWYEPDSRRDIDNIAAGGTKLIMDSLVNAGVIKDDSQKYVKGIAHEFAVDKHNARIEVEIMEVDGKC